ncbi:MAG: hypothetical protein LBF80_03230 [Spirochaetaceae bacterium]|nr:hypothetical protein [Spirochaetaceae bacterium]
MKGDVTANGKITVTGISLSGTMSAPMIEFKGENSDISFGANGSIKLTGENPRVIVNSGPGKSGVDLNISPFTGNKL